MYLSFLFRGASPLFFTAPLSLFDLLLTSALLALLLLELAQTLLVLSLFLLSLLLFQKLPFLPLCMKNRKQHEVGPNYMSSEELKALMRQLE